MEMIFILVEPQVAENIGAAARAINTMGFEQLRVVNSDLHKQDKARWVAHGSWDILESVQRFDDLGAAVADCDLVVGTTAKKRGDYRDLHTPETLKTVIDQKSDIVDRVALVFGREDKGLSNQQLECCDLLTSIPLANPYPSLNLSQAVMLYAYALSGLQGEPRQLRPSQNQQGQFHKLKQRVAELMELEGYDQKSKLWGWAQQRMASLNSEDVHFLHTVCSALERRRS
ncbi:MAG: tRNA/rRNA methyltransferase [Motiliproteus sp.]|nr:tRNA/rRNA methyltransferase [Motiliproteus sp.]MCW9052896.1 tRNA/rRNA methyltransferase [Motiliproteus sp.]